MTTEITPSTFESYLKEVTIPLKQPTVVWGQPGIGKTEIIQKAAEAMDYTCHAIYLPQFEPWDLQGLPVPVNGKTEYYPPLQMYPDNEKVVLFLDEIAQCSTAMQSMASRIVYERKLGDFELPENWVVVLAGNRQEDKAGTTRVSSHINNRVTHLNLVVKGDDWVRWALHNDIDMRAIKFIQMREEMLNTFNPDEKTNATPRTWERVSEIISHTNNKQILHPALVGTLGEEVGTAFYGFLDIFDNMVDINQVIMSPDRTEVPEDPSTLFAVSAALVSKANEENIDRIFTYARRMPEEFQVRTVQDMATRHDWATNTKTYTTWAIDHSDLYLAAA
ncbi:MAG: AAA domain-containing protein [Gammaproteobacteria bacterium]|jgi:MoxR-like ATPase|nr:AAA domain-containing protein [Gammaproteobacteria bacterium]